VHLSWSAQSTTHFLFQAIKKQRAYLAVASPHSRSQSPKSNNTQTVSRARPRSPRVCRILNVLPFPSRTPHIHIHIQHSIPRCFCIPLSSLSSRQHRASQHPQDMPLGHFPKKPVLYYSQLAGRTTNSSAEEEAYKPSPVGAVRGRPAKMALREM